MHDLPRCSLHSLQRGVIQRVLGLLNRGRQRSSDNDLRCQLRRTNQKSAVKQPVNQPANQPTNQLLLWLLHPTTTSEGAARAQNNTPAGNTREILKLTFVAEEGSLGVTITYPPSDSSWMPACSSLERCLASTRGANDATRITFPTRGARCTSSTTAGSVNGTQ